VSQHHPLPPGIGPARINGAPRQSKQHGDAGMMILAKIVYWLMSILAALLLALTAVLLVDIAYGEEMPDWWLHALSLALLAICVWFVGMVIPIFRAAHIGIDHGAIDIGVKAASVGGPFAEALVAILVRRIF
jgi:hypothetical protein